MSCRCSNKKCIRQKTNENNRPSDPCENTLLLQGDLVCVGSKNRFLLDLAGKIINHGIEVCKDDNNNMHNNKKKVFCNYLQRLQFDPINGGFGFNSGGKKCFFNMQKHLFGIWVLWYCATLVFDTQ